MMDHENYPDYEVIYEWQCGPVMEAIELARAAAGLCMSISYSARSGKVLDGAQRFLRRYSWHQELVDVPPVDPRFVRSQKAK